MPTPLPAQGAASARRLGQGAARGYENLDRGGAQRAIRSAFASDEYAARRKEIGDMFRQQRDEIFKAIDRKAEEAGFLIQVSPIGLMTLPLVDGKPLPEEQFLALSDAAKEEISQQQKALRAELDTAVRQVKGLERETTEAIRMRES